VSSNKKPKDGSENGRYTKKHSAKVLDELRKQGFLLEILANQTLDKKGWVGNMQKAYWSRPKRKLSSEDIHRFSLYEFEVKDRKRREIDIHSSKGDTIDHPKFDEYCIELVIDCKYRFDENWVFFARPNLLQTPNESSPLSSFLIREGSCYSYFELIERTGYIELNSDLHNQLQKTSHQSWYRQRESARTSASLFRNDKSIFSTCEQIADAYDWLLLENLMSIHNRIGQGKEKLCYFIMYPVVIVDGPLWLLRLEKEEPILTKADCLTFYFSREKENYAIDFVSWDEIGTYLGILDEELNRIRKVLSDGESVYQ
jgi:hypothetical protein